MITSRLAQRAMRDNPMVALKNAQYLARMNAHISFEQLLKSLRRQPAPIWNGQSAWLIRGHPWPLAPSDGVFGNDPLA
jgi:hypothetical protein